MSVLFYITYRLALSGIVLSVHSSYELCFVYVSYEVYLKVTAKNDADDDTTAKEIARDY